ncbi:MAG: efflux RND transporter permease subunit [Leptospirales bacterium]|nr:efflux RND transporter permease subunit [Leptospirales bacterium]
MLYQAHRIGEILRRRSDVQGVFVETPAFAPEWKLSVEHPQASAAGLSPPQIARFLSLALGGRSVGRVYEEERSYEIIMRLPDAVRRSRQALAAITLHYRPDGSAVRVGDVVDIYESEGPYEILRNNGERRMTVQFASRPGAGGLEVARAVERDLLSQLQLPQGYRLEMGGRLRARQTALERMAWISLGALVLILGGLYWHFRSWSLCLQALINLPLAFIGGVIALWISGAGISVASLVGFVALAGIAARNGLLMLTRFERMIHEEGREFNRQTIIAGALDRLAPVLMTASCAVLGLAPVLLGGAAIPGREILFPVATVIVGGLLSSTLLDLVLTPLLYYLLGRHRYAPEALP